MMTLMLDLAAMLLRLVGVPSHACGTVCGTLREDGSCVPLGRATVMLRHGDSDEVARGCLTDRCGAFSLGEVPPGRYYVEGCRAGCASARSVDFVLAEGQTVDVGTLLMSGMGWKEREQKEYGI